MQEENSFQKKAEILKIFHQQKMPCFNTYRVIYQANIWFTSHERMPLIPSPEGKGWVLESNQLKPVWMTKPVAAKVCKELVRCHCQSEKGCRFCKCIKLGLTCTERCRCFCSLHKK